MVNKISRDAPLSEITLRRYEKPYQSTKREMVRKLCLSIGLLQPGDSRDVIVDIFQVLIKNKRKKVWLNSEEIRTEVIATRTQNKIPLIGVAPSNIRRQIKRLRDIMLVENINNNYRIKEFEDLSIIFEKQIKGFYLTNILERVEDYFREIK
ncbi:hypothetical protein HOD61_00355 [archaeon]|jgi:hypothetical protein|nr:hypothetical protein [archaeon]